LRPTETLALSRAWRAAKSRDAQRYQRRHSDCLGMQADERTLIAISPRPHRRSLQCTVAPWTHVAHWVWVTREQQAPTMKRRPQWPQYSSRWHSRRQERDGGNQLRERRRWRYQYRIRRRKWTQAPTPQGRSPQPNLDSGTIVVIREPRQLMGFSSSCVAGGQSRESGTARGNPALVGATLTPVLSAKATATYPRFQAARIPLR
jgi:hypothetical protein